MLRAERHDKQILMMVSMIFSYLRSSSSLVIGFKQKKNDEKQH
jgi:hypothetical protein